MNILFVAPYAPNPVRVRPYEFVRTLLRRGHAVTLAALWTSDAERADMARLAALGATVISESMPTWRSLRNSAITLPSRTPLQTMYSWNPALMAQIQTRLRAGKIDAVHVEHLRGSRYAVSVRAFFGANPTHRCPIVWDSVDSISYLFEQAVQSSRSLKARLLTWIELERTRRHEARLVGLFERTLVTSALDKAAFVGLLDRYAGEHLHSWAARIEVIGNGVDLEHFAFRNPRDRVADRIIFSGKMSYHANVTAALHLVNDIMPRVWAQRPTVQVWLVGKDPVAEVRKLAESAPMLPGSTERRVVVTGAVASMPEYIQSATLAVAPLLYGAGIQNKALEALACGTPVVATAQATGALRVRTGEELLIADGPEAFADAILKLLSDVELRARLGEAGRRYVEAYHSWDAAAQQLETAYNAPLEA
ncbi:MAG TPA: glycosyl transferase family 1 [Chloroflexi bacterium]|nr:glycosyl transferase family 1 [Chloroflexota bacterium]HHW87746.1 glycosyltransferase [Chloroflexota bacterium]